MLADAMIVLVAVITVWIPSAWFDIVAGLGIGLLNVDAARTVWMRARAEQRQLEPERRRSSERRSQQSHPY